MDGIRKAAIGRYYKNGTRLTGWQNIGGKWYYFNGSGVMQTSKWISGSTMAVSEWVDQKRYYVGANGK